MFEMFSRRKTGPRPRRARQLESGCAPPLSRKPMLTASRRPGPIDAFRGGVGPVDRAATPSDHGIARRSWRFAEAQRCAGLAHGARREQRPAALDEAPEAVEIER